MPGLPRGCGAFAGGAPARRWPRAPRSFHAASPRARPSPRPILGAPIPGAQLAQAAAPLPTAAGQRASPRPDRRRRHAGAPTGAAAGAPYGARSARGARCGAMRAPAAASAKTPYGARFARRACRIGAPAPRGRGGQGGRRERAHKRSARLSPKSTGRRTVGHGPPLRRIEARRFF